MAGINYKEIILNLSSAYERRGRVGHDELLDSLKSGMTESSYKILNRVVLKEYIETRGADNRIFGAFSEWDIESLVKKCQESEDSLNIPLR